MNIDSIGPKLKEWLTLKNEADTLEKAREDKLVHPDQRADFREQKKDMQGSDPYQWETTSVPGVSDRGIEARRADKKNPGVVSHGYGRTTSPDVHRQRAIQYFKGTLERVKAQKKPNLPKSEDDLQKMKLSIPLGPHMGSISGIDIGGDKPKDKDKKRRSGFSSTTITSAPVASAPAAPALAASEKVKVVPADDSDPMVINSRMSFSSPKQTNGPNIINAYKSEEGSRVSGEQMIVSDIVNFLRKKKRG